MSAPLAGDFVVAGDPEFQRPSFAMYQTATQSVPNTTLTPITMNAELFDTLNGHSTSVLTNRYTPTVAGWWFLIGQVAWALSTVGDRNAQWRKNGATLDGAPYGPMPALNGAAFLFGGSFCIAAVFLNGTTDWVELCGNQNSGGALNTAYSANQTHSMGVGWWMHD